MCHEPEAFECPEERPEGVEKTKSSLAVPLLRIGPQRGKRAF